MIPEWNMAGVLPPIYPGGEGASPNRSPYKTDLYQIVDRLAFSQERINILQGFLLFRAELNRLGIETGFQWIDGSFLEKVEDLESRSPNDIDVVTFFELPGGETQKSLWEKKPELFESSKTKSEFSVDAYFHILGKPTDELEIRKISYWHSLWSHRRDLNTWKGFIQVKLSQTDDKIAKDLLDSIQRSGVEL